VFQGRDVTGLSPAQRNTGMVFQNYALFPHMTVADNVAYGLRLRRWPADKRQRRVAEMLDLVGLGGYDARYPRQLSGGQQQRVAIARALAYDPPLLLMDEPLGALDRALRLEMVEQIRRIHRELETTIVYVTHDQQEALGLSDRIAILRDGLIVEVGTPEQLYRRPRTVFVAHFFGAANLLDAEIVNRGADGATQVRCGGSQVDGVHGPEGASKLAVRPRSLRPATPGASGLAVSGEVVDALLLGDERQIILSAGPLGRITAALPAEGSDHVTVGSRLDLVAPPDQLALVEDD
jgi:putative spermidine/putrescine transport system ATP-binding protein